MDMIERVSRALCSAAGLNPNNWSNPLKVAQARAAIEAMKPVDVRCPFCGEDGFDKIGLKIHLHWCAAYEETPLADPPQALSPSLKEQEEGN